MPNLAKLAAYPAPVRILAFVGLLLILWLPLALLGYQLLPTQVSGTLALVVLYTEFLWLTGWWGRIVHQEPRMLQRYGFVWTATNGRYLGQGLGIGLVSLLAMFVFQGAMGWVSWQVPVNPGKAAIEGLLVATAIGIAEELLFRGWLLDELERDYPPSIVLYATSSLFAVLHFIKPIAVILQTWPQFAGLMLLGIALVWAKRAARGLLGLAIGLHAGLVWGYYIVNVGQLVTYTNRVPAWVTGIDRNPLAGLVGLVGLGTIAIWIQHRASQAQSPDS